MSGMTHIPTLALESMVKKYEEEIALMRAQISKLLKESQWLRTELEGCQHSYKVLNELSSKQYIELRRMQAERSS
jgi:predicted RNase H-like nuclease (RuvC/YqgF family)